MIKWNLKSLEESVPDSEEKCGELKIIEMGMRGANGEEF